MAEGLGIVAPATIWAAETTYAKHRLARIQRNMREAVGWSELAGAELTAAAGARPSAGEVLRCTGKRAERLYGLLASPGTR